MVADELDPYCKKNLKGSYSAKKKESICWCVDDNLQLLTAEEREYLVSRSQKKKKAESQPPTSLSADDKKRVERREFEIFKNCSVNYKWKANQDDIGVPDDITAP